MRGFAFLRASLRVFLRPSQQRKEKNVKKDRLCIKILQLKHQLKKVEKKIDMMLKTSANKEKTKKDN